MGASSEPESYENPTTAVREAFGDAFFFSLQLQSRPPPPKRTKPKNRGKALYYCPSNITGDDSCLMQWSIVEGAKAFEQMNSHSMDLASLKPSLEAIQLRQLVWTPRLALLYLATQHGIWNWPLIIQPIHYSCFRLLVYATEGAT